MTKLLSSFPKKDLKQEEEFDRWSYHYKDFLTELYELFQTRSANKYKKELPFSTFCFLCFEGTRKEGPDGTRLLIEKY